MKKMRLMEKKVGLVDFLKGVSLRTNLIVLVILIKLKVLGLKENILFIF